MTALWVPTAGQIPTANQVATFRPNVAVKVADQTINNSAALVNDAELAVPVVANVTYHFECRLLVNSNSTANFKSLFTFPSGLTMLYTTMAIGVGGSVWGLFEADQTTTTVVGGAGANRSTMLWGIVNVGSTAGTLQIQWAQNVANVSNTIMRAGSYLNLTQVV